MRPPAAGPEIGWSQARSGEREMRFEPGEAARTVIAKTLDLEALGRLRVDFSVRPWRDGVQIDGVLSAAAGRICGVSLEPFEEIVESRFRRRLVRPRSPNAEPAGAREVIIDPQSEDPPESFEGERIGLEPIAVEELSLALDPFPRKPGAAFEPPADARTASPFAALSALDTQRKD